jgi:hypothetical protein
MGLALSLGLHVFAAFGPQFVLVLVNQTGISTATASLVVEHQGTESTLDRPGWRLHIVPMPRSESVWRINCGGRSIVSGYLDGMTELDVVTLNGCALVRVHWMSVV